MLTNQGYEIIQSEATSRPGERETGIAIARALNPGAPSQWVTWRYAVRGDGFDFASGNYFSERRMAFRDYHRRLMAEYDS